jgi:hypothetical protein
VAQPGLRHLGEAFSAAWQGIDRVRQAWRLPYSFLRRAGVSVARAPPAPGPDWLARQALDWDQSPVVPSSSSRMTHGVAVVAGGLLNHVDQQPAQVHLPGTGMGHPLVQGPGVGCDLPAARTGTQLAGDHRVGRFPVFDHEVGL